jgi:hypothetical protein
MSQRTLAAAGHLAGHLGDAAAQPGCWPPNTPHSPAPQQRAPRFGPLLCSKIS